MRLRSAMIEHGATRGLFGAYVFVIVMRRSTTRRDLASLVGDKEGSELRTKYLVPRIRHGGLCSRRLVCQRIREFGTACLH